MALRTSKKYSQLPAETVSVVLAFAVIGVGILVTIFIVLIVGFYRNSYYQEEIKPEQYAITDIDKGESTMTHADGTDTTNSVYRVTVIYNVDGNTYTDKIQMLSGTKEAQAIYTAYQNCSNPEEQLGSLFYNSQNPSVIGRYGDSGIFVK